MQKNGFIRKLWLISKSVTSQTWQQIITITQNISKSKGNQAIKFGLLIKYSENNNFLDHAENEVGTLVQDHFFLKFFNKVIASGQKLRFQYNLVDLDLDIQ